MAIKTINHPSKCRTLAIFSDIHFGKSKDSPIKLKANLAYVPWLLDKCCSNGADAVLFMGDWFENRNSLSIGTINDGSDCLRKIAGTFPTYMIVGNHDTFQKADNTINSIRPFREIKGLTIIENDPTIVEMCGKKIIMCPWECDITKITDRYDYAAGHFEYNGASLADSVEKGKSYGITELAELAPIIFTGHYHINSLYNTRGGVIINVGSPLELDWGDYGNKKYLYFLKIESGEIVKVENDISPIHVKYQWAGLQNKTQEITKEKIANNYVSLVVDEKFKFQDVAKMIDAINNFGPARPCEVDYVYNYMKELAVTTDKKVDSVKITKFEYIRKFVDNLDATKLEGISKDTLMEMADGYYRKVMHE